MMRSASASRALSPRDYSEKTVSGLAVDLSGSGIVTGWFRDNVDFGCGLLCSQGERDSYLVKLAP